MILNFKALLCFLLSFASLDVFPQSLDDDLLLHYKLDGNAIDASSNSFHGIENAINFVDDEYGVFNGAGEFNGSNSFVDFPNVEELHPQLPLTFAFNVKFDDITNTNAIVFTNDFGKDIHSGVWMNISSTGKLAINFGDGGITNSSHRRSKLGSTSLVTNVWYHVAAMISGPTDMEIYLDCVNDNGTYQGSGGDLFYSGSQGSLGRKDNGGSDPFYLDGTIDNFRYYNRILTLEELGLLCDNFFLEIVNVNAVNCNNSNNGSVEVMASGSYENIMFSIDDGPFQVSPVFENLSQGSYVITAVDNNDNSTSIEVTIEAIPDLQIVLVESIDNSCTNMANGRFTVMAEGGSPPYVYLLDEGISSTTGVFNALGPATYIVEVIDANGCESSIEVIIESPSPLFAEILDVVDEECPQSGDGSISVGAIGGTSPYAFILNSDMINSTGAFNNLESGTYSVEIIDDNDCISSIVIEIESSEEILIEMDILNVTCEDQADGSIELNSSDYTYAIDNGEFQEASLFSNLGIGEYLISAMNDNGCIVDTIINIINLGEHDFNFVVNQPCIDTQGGSIQVIADGQSDSYQYALNDSEYQTSNLFVDLQEGSYSLSVKDENDCTSSIESIDLVSEFCGECEFYVPNIIAQKSVVGNHIFKLTSNHEPCVEDLNMIIYDRWGSEIYSGLAVLGWDSSTVNFNIVKGVYVYLILGNANGGEIALTGTITVI